MAVTLCVCVCLCACVCLVLPSGGKVVRLEELEAAQLSPPLAMPVIPSASTPAENAATSTKLANVSQDGGALQSDARRFVPAAASGVTRAPGPAGRMPADTTPSGPSHTLLSPVHRPTGPPQNRSLPAGAQVQTLEEIEAGLRSVDVSSPPKLPVKNAGIAVADASGDLTAFNKLLNLVNKTQTGADQARNTTRFYKVWQKNTNMLITKLLVNEADIFPQNYWSPIAQIYRAW